MWHSEKSENRAAASQRSPDTARERALDGDAVISDTARERALDGDAVISDTARERAPEPGAAAVS